MNNNSYDRKIAQKLKKLDRAYVEDEDKKELVGGNVRELVDIKDGMGLQGMGLSAGMKKMIKKEQKKGKGMSAGAQLGYDGPPVWKDNITPPFLVAGGMSAGGLLDILKMPFKILGMGKNGKKIELKGAGLMDIFDPVKLIKFGRMALGDKEDGSGIGSVLKNVAMTSLGPLAIPLKLMGLGKDNKYYEMEGCGAITDTIQKLLVKLHPLMMMKGVAEREFKKAKKGKGMSAGAINRNGNQGLIGYGNCEEKEELEGDGIISDILQQLNPLTHITRAVSESFNKGKKYGKRYQGSGMSAGKKKAVKKNAPKDGAGLMSVLSDIASLPSKIIPNTFSSPLEDMFGSERGRNVSKAIVESMMEGKGMKGRPTKQNLPSSSFSGGAKKKSGKPNKRAEIVKKIMKERGVSMIEASKIVKNEGLY